MSAVIAALVGAVCGVLSGFGVGGGSLLLLYLTLVAGMEQFAAGGINLVYFLACAPAAVYAHLKNGLIDKPAVKMAIFAGVPAAVLGAVVAARMDTDLLRRIFGIVLLYIGAKELCCRKEQN